MKRLIVPKIEPIEIDVTSVRLSDYGRRLFGVYGEDELSPMGRLLLGLRCASDSNYAEKKILEHKWGKASWTMPATVAVALCTVVPEDGSTGATITEASYTGYARKVVAAAALGAAAEGAPSEIKNSGEALTFAECTAGSSTVVGFAICDSSTKGAGNVITWGTTTSTAISTTATPATIALSGLVGTQD